MAHQKGPNFLDKVTIDGIIYYKWRGLYLMRKAPGKGGVKQTEATRLSAATFGTASTAAKLLYSSFKKIIPLYLQNFNTYNRTKKIMSYVVGKGGSCENADLWNYTYLENFSFNEYALFQLQRYDFTVQQLLAKKKFKVSFPGMELRKITIPKNAHTIGFRLAAGAFDFAKNKLLNYQEKDVNHNLEQDPIPAMDLLIDLKSKPGTITIICLQILFYNSKNQLISSKRKPERDISAILWANVNL